LSFHGCHFIDNTLRTNLDQLFVVGSEVSNATSFIDLVLERFTLLCSEAEAIFHVVKCAVSCVLIEPIRYLGGQFEPIPEADLERINSALG